MDKPSSFVSSAEPVRNHQGFPIHLTHRQHEVLLLLCEGLPNKLIGRRLGLSDATVKCHVASVLRSLNVATRLEAVSVAYRLGLVSLLRSAAGGLGSGSRSLDGFGVAVAA